VNITNSRPRVAQVSEKLLRRLRELNTLDLEFYRILQEQWNKIKENNLGPVLSVSRWMPYNQAPYREFTLPEFTLLHADSDASGPVFLGQTLHFTVDFCLAEPVGELEMGIHIFDADHRWAFGTNTTLLSKKFANVRSGTHRIQFQMIIDLPEGDYTAGFAFADSLTGHRELAWFDKLIAFHVSLQRRHAGVGYSDMIVDVVFDEISTDSTLGPVTDASGTLRILGELAELGCSEVLNVPVVLENTSAQVWKSTPNNPLALSYHWLDSEWIVQISEGGHTELPTGLVLPAEPMELSLRVVAPPTPGEYRLFLLVVQEGVASFDSLGFSPLLIDVSVLGAGQDRHYSGADERLISNLGLRVGRDLVATGGDDFLIYGPYVALLAGTYIARLHISVSAELDGAWVDVVGSYGAVEFGCMRGLSLLPSKKSIELKFVLPEDCPNVEVRFWIPTGAQVSVHELHILRQS